MSNATSLDHLTLDVVLPWHDNEIQFERFKVLAQRIVIPLMVFLIVMPLLPDFTDSPEVVKKVVTELALEPPEPVVIPEEPVVETPAKPKIKKVKAKENTPPKAKSADAKKASLAALSKQLSALSSSAGMLKQKKKNVFVADSGKVQKKQPFIIGAEKCDQHQSWFESL
jgi:hypothetical protein